MTIRTLSDALAACLLAEEIREGYATKPARCRPRFHFGDGRNRPSFTTPKPTGARTSKAGTAPKV